MRASGEVGRTSGEGVPGVGRGWAGCRARAGGEKSGGTVGKRQRGSKLSNKQEKAKGKAQESRHQNRFPPLFDRAPPLGCAAGVSCALSRAYSVWDAQESKAPKLKIHLLKLRTAPGYL